MRQVLASPASRPLRPILRSAMALLVATCVWFGSAPSLAQSPPPPAHGASPGLSSPTPASPGLSSPTLNPAPAPIPAASLAPAQATSATPAAPFAPAVLDWPTGDELRLDLQRLGFTFRVDPATGDWLGWAPATSPRDTRHHLDLGGAGGAPARATVELDLLQLEASSEAVSSTLTALYEVIARVPLESTSAERARRFVIEDLFTVAPAELERCYLDETSSGVVLVLVGEATETGSAPASIHVARSAEALDGTAPIGDDPPDLLSCAQLIPEEEAAALEPRSERITIGMSDGDDPRFDPAETTLQGTLVTLILTFRNESDVEQTLTFEEPLTSGTGPVAPGGERLIVVRELEPGEYAFHSEADRDAIRGTITIEPPSLDAE